MRKVYLVPNFVTTANMFCGFYSVILSFRGDYLSAAWAIVAAGVFDMLDGRIARLTNSTSLFGVQYDSLSDLISFGMAPGVLIYLWALQSFDRVGYLAGFLFLTCGALRLARFNVNTAVIPKGYFQGLPIPMAAGTLATFVIFRNAVELPEAHESFVLGLTFLLASLMVSTIRFPAFKEVNWQSKSTFGLLAVGVLSMVLVAARPEVTLFCLFGVYILTSILWNGARFLQRRARQRSAARAGGVDKIQN